VGPTAGSERRERGREHTATQVLAEPIDGDRRVPPGTFWTSGCRKSSRWASRCASPCSPTR
jgi:hypothetical protein